MTHHNLDNAKILTSLNETDLWIRQTNQDGSKCIWFTVVPNEDANTLLSFMMMFRHLEKITDIKITVPGKGCV